MSDLLLGGADSTTALNLYAALDFLVNQKLAAISTGVLVQIANPPYDASGNPIMPGTVGPVGFVDVLPLVNQLDGQGNSTPHDIVYGLSYHRNQSGTGAFINDPVKGDIGKMLVSERDTSVVRSTGAQANPGSRRKHDKADGTYIGLSQGGTPTQWFAWLTKGFDFKDAFGNTMKGTQNGVLINGCLIDQNGDVHTKNGINVDTHTHDQPNDSHGDTEAPTNAPNVT